jgi:NitT/TauT family transport system ATP-binding protein
MEGVLVAMQSEIVLNDVHLRFPMPRGEGTLQILADFSLEIERESFTVLLGPSGCGKSTLLNLISGLTEPTSAKRLEVFGRDIRLNPEVTRQIAYVFQTPRLLPWKTIWENVHFGLKGLRVQPEEKWNDLIEHYLALVGLEDFAHYYPHQVSGGMQQRASIVRAWANEPRILLMDEPFSHLDEISAGRLRSELIDLWRRESPRRTVVFVTHDIGEAVELGQRIVMLSARPAAIFHDQTIAMEWPRDVTDERLFKLEKDTRQTFFDHIRGQRHEQ